MSERPKWADDLLKLKLRSRKTFEQLALESKQINPSSALSKAAIQRTIMKGSIPRTKEGFLTLIDALEVDRYRDRWHWEYIWENLHAGRHVAEGPDELALIDPDPPMSAEDEKWKQRFEQEEGYDDEEELIPALPIARTIGIDYEHEWPYHTDEPGEARDSMIAWARRHGLRLARDRFCVPWLQTEVCQHSIHGKQDWTDHVTGWTRDGKPAVLVSQPYGVSHSALSQLLEIDRIPGLSVMIDGTGWYGHGTTFITIWKGSAKRQ